jgi:L-fucose isomerase-like protein
MNALENGDNRVDSKAKMLKEYTSWEGVPEDAFTKITKLGVILDQVVDDFKMDCLAIRCWVEMQQVLGISPCVLLSEMNNRGIATACEVDAGNAVTMRALGLASGEVTTCLDWNNNYADDPNKCILFHCGPVPQSMMTGKGLVTDHAILANAVGQGCGWGCNTGRIAPTDFTYGSMLTEEGRLKFYLGEGKFTADPIPQDFFGCAGVAELPDLQSTLQTIGYLGHRHHVSIAPSHVAAPVHEAFEKYLGYQVDRV